MPKQEEKKINTNILAIDHGNANIKTPEQVFAASVNETLSPPALNEEYIIYNNRYYTIGQEQRPYVQDKTQDETMFITTLFAIAKEASKGYIDPKKPLIIAGGLPPVDYGVLKDCYIKYFDSHFKGGVSFRYGKKQLEATVEKTYMFIQDYSAVKAYSPRISQSGKKIAAAKILKEYDTFLAIDIGGATVDYLLFQNGVPVTKMMGSFQNGIVLTVAATAMEISKETGLRVTNEIVMDIMSGKKTVLGDNIKKLVKQRAKEAAENILNTISSAGCDMRIYPVIFFGGGSILFQDYIKGSPLLSSEVAFIDDINANARGYRMLAVEMQKQS